MSKIRIRKRGKTYSYSFDTSKNPRRMKEKGGFATEDEAFDAGVKAYADWKSGNIGVTSEKVTLRDYLASWLENVVRPNVKRTTFRSYSNAVTTRINPHIGDYYLQDLRPRDVDIWVQTLAKKRIGTRNNRAVKNGPIHCSKICSISIRVNHGESIYGHSNPPLCSAKSHKTHSDNSGAVFLLFRNREILFCT